MRLGSTFVDLTIVFVQLVVERVRSRVPANQRAAERGVWHASLRRKQCLFEIGNIGVVARGFHQPSCVGAHRLVCRRHPLRTKQHQERMPLDSVHGIDPSLCTPHQVMHRQSLRRYTLNGSTVHHTVTVSTLTWQAAAACAWPRNRQLITPAAPSTLISSWAVTTSGSGAVLQAPGRSGEAAVLQGSKRGRPGRSVEIWNDNVFRAAAWLWLWSRRFPGEAFKCRKGACFVC